MKGVLSGFALVIVLVGPAAAAPADTANSVASKVMSPYCPGVTLHDCPSDNATALILRIEGWARDGYSEAQIIDLLVAEYGPGIRAVPPVSGTGLGAWGLPLVAAVGGGVGAWWLLRRWVRPPPTPDTYDPEVHITPADRRRLERELELFRGDAV